MREPQEKIIDGRLYSVTPLPAMRALRLVPLALKGIGKMSPDEIEAFARAILSMARVDSKELMPTFDLEMQGAMSALVELLTFAIEVNFGGFSDAAPAATAAAESPSAG